MCQVRYREVVLRERDYSDDEEGFDFAGEWQELQVMDLSSLPVGQPKIPQSTYGEEHGLELGRRYIFSMRIAGRRRRSQWSIASSPIMYDVPAADVPQPLVGETLLVESLSETSVRFWWRELRGNETFSHYGDSESKRPMLEYRLDVSLCQAGGGLERHATVLLEDEQDVNPPGQADVNGLLPGRRYFAALALRFTRLGCRSWRKTGLTASFETPELLLRPA
jgi:hypothetical protein